jgi:uncharacterized protein
MRKEGHAKLIIGILILLVVVQAVDDFDYKSFLIDTVSFEQRDFSSQTLFLPAVDQEGRGVLATLLVEADFGTGKELINIDKLVFWEDTQQSIQTAKQVACEYTGVGEDSIDVIYSISSDGATVVGGPSAGAALTVATIAAIEGRELDNSVIITGTINSDQTIGPVGGILEKALAAQENGARLFLIPQGEGLHTYIEPQRTCREMGSLTYCETVYKTVSISIGDELDIEVREVANIQDALKYFQKNEA